MRKKEQKEKQGRTRYVLYPDLGDDYRGIYVKIHWAVCLSCTIFLTISYILIKKVGFFFKYTEEKKMKTQG